MKRSLQVQMVLIMTLLAISLMLVVGVMLVSNVTSFYYDNFLQQMRLFFDTAETQERLRAFDTADALYSFLLEDNILQLGFNTYRNLYIYACDEAPEAAPLLGSGDNPGLPSPNLRAALSGQVGDRAYIHYRYMDYAKPLGNYVVYIKDDKNQVRDLTWEIVMIIVEIMFLTMVIAIFLSFLLSRTITNPIERLTQGAVRVAGGDFEPIAVSSDDEIGTLTNTFNEMATTLQQTLADIEADRNKYETIFLHLTDGLLVFDGGGLLVDVNRTVRDMLGAGLRPGETRFEDIFDRERLGVDLGRLRRLGPEQTDSCTLETRGRVLQVTFAAFSLSEPGGALSSEGAIAVLRDITDQQRLELSRREFIANVSHELRTPLTNIKSYTETVLENPDLPEDNRTGFLKVALGESDRMIRIVKDLLTLSRLDDDRLDLRPRSFDAGELVQRVCEAMQLDAHNSRHALTLEVNEPGPVFGDDERLAQVLVNVVSNSVKYTPEGGKIHIEAHREGEQVCVSVRDNGIGIPPEDLGRIFERFYRVDKARSREMGGTGLGLAIAQEIIRAHGGGIDIESTPGEGTTVRLLIPVGGPGSARPNELPLRPGGASN